MWIGKDDPMWRSKVVDGWLRNDRVRDQLLGHIPHSGLREMAIDSLKAGDASGYFIMASNTVSLSLVAKNWRIFQALGIYEQALIEAYIRTRTNNYHVLPSVQSFLFRVADRRALREAGDPFPGVGPFTLYRGVAGIGRSRRIRGLSWTSSLLQAQWFAARYAKDLPSPAVFQAIVPKRMVYAYLNQGHRKEEEFIVDLPKTYRVTRIQSLDFNFDALSKALDDSRDHATTSTDDTVAPVVQVS